MKEKTGRDRIIQLFDDLDTAKLLATTKYRTACNNCKGIQDEAIAARDKWWVGQIGNKFLIKYSNGDIQELDYIVVTKEEWQEHKRSIGL